ncbi:hypothetical protein H010_09766 [Hydrogenophaga taeniospiralis CCUG 15921]|uniref:SPOR domain-containing protein n=1 Tax=Hydrogenophaga taeniospiralis CCUG 15921 TaxID=1281780 RepID=A0A9X4NQU5_9BURK|nr:SPOR domain-containing protein [Hydrogenophaga taeniospiralis]MDG5975537.1 hypothetical protein [Hydrogenophaga taeniospiralis CCUG 15921]
MPVTPPTAAIAPESATTALYRAAIGPVNTAHYLALFARFNDAGRAGPAWNGAAGFLTLNWLVFRQLWIAALGYVACAEGLSLLVLGVGRRLLQWPAAVEWGVLGALLVLSIAIPGAYGNAWLHAETRRRITRAVREARTVREACAALERQASTPRRLWGLVVINGVLVVALIGGYVAWSVVLAGRGAAVGSINTPPPAPRPAPQVATAAVPAAVSTTEPEIKPVPVPAAAPAPVAGPAKEASPVSPSAAPAMQRMPQAAPAPQPVLAPASTAAAAPPVAPPSAGFAINVGLFADPANAGKAHARLIEAGLPAFTQTVTMAKGPRVRVRVGPFATGPEAEAAAERVRALRLEAQVFPLP